MKKLLTPALVAVTAATSLLAAPAAGADTLTVHDPKGDVRVVDEDEMPRPLGDTRVNADIVRVKVTHGAGVVRARVVLDDLARNGDLQIMLLKLRTPRGRTFDLDWMSGFGKRDYLSLTSGRGWEEVPCRGLTHSVDHSRDAVSFRVPRRCLGNPGSLRFKAGVVAAESLDSATGYLDKAGSDRWKAPWSKAVRRG